jgi:uncharacterized protein YceH (UPF0502 family)
MTASEPATEPMGGVMERLPRRLDAVECRVLGALLEKEQTTPEYYPLTVNALVAACNQKTNREPVMELSEGEVTAALERLRKNVLVWSSEGARSDRWRHALDRRWRLTPATKAVVTLLLLRGPQTPGELRGRSERLRRFATPAEVETALAELASGREPLARELPRAPGQKENRWTHLAGEEAGAAGTSRAAGATAAPGAASTSFPTTPGAAPAAAGPADLAARLEALEARVAELERRLGDEGG